jgi:putative membrane protein
MRLAARSAVLAAWSAFLAWLLVSGEIARYLGPRTRWVAVVGAFGLGAAAVAAVRSERSWSRRPSAREILGLGVLLLPIVAVGLVPRPGLGALAASRKAPSQGALALGPVAAPSSPDDSEISFLDLYFANRSATYAAESGIFDGAPVRLLGFVTRTGETREGTFELTRFYVSCCAADAIPYSATVVPLGRVPQPRNDSWLEVSGRVRVVGDDFVVVPARVTPRREPRDPYLY